MSLDEAERIQANFDRGALDPDLPGTMELVNEARRRSVTAQLWGTESRRPSRTARRFVAICCAIVAVTMFALALSFFTFVQ